MPTRRQCANAIRALAMDAIEKARSGHPGALWLMADMAEALWRHGFKHNPSNPRWFDRDRFVLSNGHASMLLYSLLHLTGYDLPMEELRNFRQWGAKTAGHPEYEPIFGIEMTTGPLGQGISSAVGMALAESMLAARYNTPEHTVVDHHTYVFTGDGCLMEGVSHEACSLAGTWGLGKLIALYDSNGISIDGKIDGWFNEDVASVAARAYHWQVIGPINGHDASALDAAIAEAKSDHSRPSLIICRTLVLVRPRPIPPPATVHPLATTASWQPARPLAGRKNPSACRKNCTRPGTRAKARLPRPPGSTPLPTTPRPIPKQQPSPAAACAATCPQTGPPLRRA